MEVLLQDLRFAVRSLISRPVLALAALLCTALGIGLCTTIFSVVYAMLVRPFPFVDPDGILGIVSTNPGSSVGQAGISFLDYTDLRNQSTSFSEVGGYTETNLTFQGNSDEPEQVQGAAVSAKLFPLLGVQPVLGRRFLPEEDQPGAPGAVLLSHAMWVRSFDADPKVIGRWIQVDNVPHQIVGVMPARFQFPVKQQAWVPMAPRLSGHLRGERELDVLARVKSGVSLDRARAETAAIAQRLAGLYPDVHDGWQWRTLPLRELFVSPGMRVMSLMMMGAATFVLLVACANVANLLLARASSRQREISLRAAFGASPSRIVRQLLTESMLLAMGGGLLGAGFAVWGVRALESLFPSSTQVPYWIVFSLDLPVLLFTAVAAMATGLLSGVVPALQATKIDLLSVLNEGGRGASGGRARSRLRSSLVVGEVGLSVMLLIGGALFVRSLFQLQKVDSGFEEQPLLTLRIYLPGEAYGDDGVKLRTVQGILGRIESLPGVDAAFASNLIPLAGGVRSGTIEIAGESFPKGQEPRINWVGVTPGFFRTLNVPVELGRSFTDQEGWEGRPVAVVNRHFAERFFPGGEAIGRRFLLEKAAEPQWLTIVGVARNFKTVGLDEPPSPAAYLPYRFLPPRNNGIVIRTALDAAQLTPAVRREIRVVDPGIPVFEVATMSEVRETSIWEYRLVSKMFSLFGCLALFLAAIGIYGVLSYTVTQRWREIGTRIALGAQRRAVLSLVVRQGLSLAFIGVAFGLAGAFLLSRVLSSFLYGIQAADPLSFGLLSLFLLAVAGMASYLPARRATKVNPVNALRAS